MKLFTFILQNMEPILQEWENFARSIQPSHRSMDVAELRDHAREVLEEIAQELVTTLRECKRAEKQSTQVVKVGGLTAAEIHAETRIESGFTIDQLVAEYRAMRASVLNLWSSRTKTAAWFELDDMSKFNDAVDRSLADSVARYSQMLRQSQDIFLGILGHDLRTPLQSISLGAEFLMRSEGGESKLIKLGSRMFNSTSRMNEILDNLLDFTKSRIGNGMQISLTNIDLASVSEQVAEEFRFSNPDRPINTENRGNLNGKWDAGRIGQVYQNLIGNALEHGSQTGVVYVLTCERDVCVEITVHNEGEPIPPSAQKNIFDPLRRYSVNTSPLNEGKNLGLGLYIVREIVVAHNGTVSVNSTKEEGTTFFVQLPKD